MISEIRILTLLFVGILWIPCHEIQLQPAKPFLCLKYSWTSIERISRDWAKLCLILKLPYCRQRNNYKISHDTEGKMPYRRACLISGCALVKLYCIYFERFVTFVWKHIYHFCLQYFQPLASVVWLLYDFEICWDWMRFCSKQGQLHSNAVADGWVGAIIEVTPSFGQEQWGQKTQKPWKSKMWRTDWQMDGPTEGRTDRRTNKVGCRVA